jgi:hypothetical protein
MGYYDAAQHAGDTGTALADLVLATVVPTESSTIEDARGRLLEAVQRRRPELARCRTLSQIGLAKLMLVTGDVDEAVTLAENALVTAESIRSRRVAVELAHLDRLTERHADRAEVQVLRGRLAVATLA